MDPDELERRIEECALEDQRQKSLPPDEQNKEKLFGMLEELLPYCHSRADIQRPVDVDEMEETVKKFLEMSKPKIH